MSLSGTWRSICKAPTIATMAAACLVQYRHVAVGSGDRSDVWHDQSPVSVSSADNRCGTTCLS